MSVMRSARFASLARGARTTCEERVEASKAEYGHTESQKSNQEHARAFVALFRVAICGLRVALLGLSCVVSL